MMPKFHTGLVYDEYVGHLKKIKFVTGFKTSLIDKAQILSRLKQKYVSTTIYDYNKKYSEYVQIHDVKPSANYFDDQLKLSFNSVAKSVAEFVFEWIVFLICILQNRFTNSKSIKTFSLLFGLGSESILNQNADKRFVSYLNSYNNHKIEPFKNFDSLVVQSSLKINSTVQNIFYAKYPHAFIFKKYNFTWTQYLKIIGLHFLSLIDIIKIVTFNFELIRLSRDFSCLRVFKFISDLGLVKDVIYTNSNYMAQPLWMRLSHAGLFKVHKIHYSQNSRQLVYKDYLNEAVNPCFYEVYADTVWVWTDDFKKFASRVYNCADIRVVGPIMFYLPTMDKKNIQFNKNEFNISLFDVTPINDSHVSSHGILVNYYSGENLKKFTNDIINGVAQIEKELNIRINIFLKHKRYYHKIHEPSYIELCNRLEAEKRIIMVPYDENVFDLISGTDINLSIPYTSTAHVGAYLNKTSLYYDPTGTVLLQPDFNEKIILIDNDKKLQSVLKQLVQDKLK